MQAKEKKTLGKQLPIIPWMGGKRRLARHILPIFGDHTCYVEPFSGGAALYFMKHPSEVEVLNDINGELVNLYRVVKHHLDEFLRHFRWALVSRQDFMDARDINPSHLTDVQRAARFFYLQKLAFGGKVHGQTFGTATTVRPRLNLLRIEEDLSAAHFRLARTTIEHLPWLECAERYDRPTTLCYMDPPYFGTAGYGVDFGIQEYVKMADFARNCSGQVVISVNDIPEMRDIFSGLSMQCVGIKYTVGGADKVSNGNELIISNR